MILDDLLAQNWRPCGEHELKWLAGAKRGVYSPRGWREYPDCLCNERPPPVVITMYVHVYQGQTYTSFEVRLTGESKHKTWHALKAYGLKEAEVMLAVEQIIKAWKAINE